MIITQDELKKIRTEHKDKTIVIGLGSFDLFHWEHLQFINDCKKLGDILVIAVKDNLAVRAKGANKPIIDEQQRLEIVDNIKAVDYVVLANERIDITYLIDKYNISENQIEREWWQFFYPIFKKLKPDVLHCELHHPELESRKQYLIENNIKFVERQYRGLITTTKIINKIKTGA